MADWDADSPRLTENLVGVLRRARIAAIRRDAPSLEDARLWHRDMMAGLRVPHPSHVGCFRGDGDHSADARQSVHVLDDRLRERVGKADRRGWIVPIVSSLRRAHLLEISVNSARGAASGASLPHWIQPLLGCLANISR